MCIKFIELSLNDDDVKAGTRNPDVWTYGTDMGNTTMWGHSNDFPSGSITTLKCIFRFMESLDSLRSPLHICVNGPSFYLHYKWLLVTEVTHQIHNVLALERKTSHPPWSTPTHRYLSLRQLLSSSWSNQHVDDWIYIAVRSSIINIWFPPRHPVSGGLIKCGVDPCTDPPTIMRILEGQKPLAVTHWLCIQVTPLVTELLK